jgi:hypothetical protein
MAGPTKARQFGQKPTPAGTATVPCIPSSDREPAGGGSAPSRPAAVGSGSSPGVDLLCLVSKL